MKSRIKSALLAAALIALGTLETFGAGYTSPAIPFPNLTLAASTATNLSGGWTNTTTVTNSTLLYTNGAGGGSPGFFTNTVITTNSVIQFAQGYAGNQRNVGIEVCFTGNGAGTDQYIFWIAKSVDGVNYDTTQNQIVAFTQNGTTQVNGITNIDMFGFGYWRILTVSNASGARAFTNNSWSASQITTASGSASAAK